jgi:chemotaxis protein MotB
MADKSAHKPALIIVKRKHRAHEAHHGGAWKVAYADFVTAMMAFFMVMWLINQNADVKTAVGGYFRDPLGSSDVAGAKAQGASGVLSHGASAMDGHDGLLDVPLLDGNADERPTPEQEKRELEALADGVRRALTQVPDFEKVAHLVEVKQSEEGLRIELMESESGTFFERGSKQLSPVGRQVVRAIASVLGKSRHPAVIEGHTDAVAYSGRDYSNWDLSTDRANAARRLLTEGGLDAGQVKGIRGYAAERPRFRERPEDPRNRRVSVLLPNLAPESTTATASPPPNG